MTEGLVLAFCSCGFAALLLFLAFCWYEETGRGKAWRAGYRVGCHTGVLLVPGREHSTQAQQAAWNRGNQAGIAEYYLARK